jgi:hypothetical protein
MTALNRNDIFFASARMSSPIFAAQPAPRSRGGKINPHITRCFLRDGHVSDVFHVKPVYYETRDGLWRPLSEITAYHGNRLIVLKPEAMSRCSMRFLQWLARRQALTNGLLEFGYPDTFYWGAQPRDLYTALSLITYPDADPETTSVDGYISKDGSSWATTRDAAIGDAAFGSSTFLQITTDRTGGHDYAISRAFVLFDTSSLGDSDTITDATLDLYVTAITNADDDGNDYLSLVSSAPASNTALITSDYNDVGSTEYGNVPDIGSLTTSAYNTLTLTEAGRDTISKTGVSKFALREGHDFNNSAPGGENTVTAYSADRTGTAEDPKLTITYTSAVSAGDGLSVFFG